MDWWECGDIKVYDDAGEVLYSGPKFIRCEEWGCKEIVTDGQIKAHGACKCGNRRFRTCTKLTAREKRRFLEGKYLLSEWEHKLIFGKDNIYLPDATFGKPKQEPYGKNWTDEELDKIDQGQWDDC